MKTNKQIKRVLLDVANIRWTPSVNGGRFAVFGRADRFLKYTSTVSIKASEVK